MERTLADGTTTATNTCAWDYDALGHLVEKVLDSTNNAIDSTATYEFALTGNHLSQAKDTDRNGTTDETTTYTYDSNDRLLTEALDTNGIAGAEQTTTYAWTGTQQAGKTVVNEDGTRVITAHMYDLRARLRTVTTEYRSGTNSSPAASASRSATSSVAAFNQQPVSAHVLRSRESG